MCIFGRDDREVMSFILIWDITFVLNWGMNNFFHFDSPLSKIYLLFRLIRVFSVFFSIFVLYGATTS